MLFRSMSAYSDNRCLQTEEEWTRQLDADDHSRAANIRELYHNLKFSGIEYYNYDAPLNDPSDKVAFTLAHKYINAGDHVDDLSQGEDTVIAIVIRGGCYGAEWASDFNVVNGTDYDSDHYGFKIASDEVKEKVNAYVSSLNRKDRGIRGQLKIWITGYSRGAAVANKVAHDLNYNGIGGRDIHTGNIYAYTFATPNVATRNYNGKPSNISYHYYKKDADIFNIVSPADAVPRAPLYKWGYGRYGRTLYLPVDNYDGLWNMYAKMSGKTLTQTQWISSTQKTSIDGIERILGLRINNRIEYRIKLQNSLWKRFYDSNQKPSENMANSVNFVFDILRGLFSVSNISSNPPRMEGLDYLDFLEGDILNALRAHEPEHYYARLFKDKLDSEDDFKELVPTNRTIIRGLDDNHDFVLVIYKNGIEVGRCVNNDIWVDHTVECDGTGAVINREQTVSIEEISGVYYIDTYDPECTIKIISAEEQNVSVEMETLNEEYEVEKVRLQDSITIKEDGAVELSTKDWNPEPGNETIPDDDSKPENQPSAVTKITYKGNVYKTTNNKTKTLALIKAKDTKIVTIPASIRIKGKAYKVTQINAKSFSGRKIRLVTIGKNVKTIKKNAFKGSNATRLILRTILLQKSTVKGSLKSSKVKRIQVKVSTKKVNKKYVKKYKKIFTKANSGRKVTVK